MQTIRRFHHSIKIAMQFAPYNNKGFLCPDSIHSMAAFHAKIYENGEYRFRIHDCITSIRLIGKLETEQDFREAFQKTSNLALALTQFAFHVDTLRCQLFPEPQIDESTFPECDADGRCEHVTKTGRCTKYVGFCNRQIP